MEQMPECVLWSEVHLEGKKKKSEQHQNNHLLQKSLTGNRGLSHTLLHRVQMEKDWDRVRTCLRQRWELKEVFLSQK